MPSPVLTKVLHVKSTAHRAFAAVALARWSSWEGAAHRLFLSGALFLAVFGWGLCQLAGLDGVRWLPLWFVAALFIYNVDRQQPTAADFQNLPLRSRSHHGLARVSRVLMYAAGGWLLGQPLWQCDWLTLAAVLLGGGVCLSYCLPQIGVPVRSLGWLKTLFPAAGAVAAVLGLPLLHAADIPAASLLVAPVAAWALLLLSINTVLCDARDLRGDALTATRSLPAQLGPRGTRRLLGALWAASVAGAAMLGFAAPAPVLKAAWLVAAMLTALVAALVIRVSSHSPGERFYERWVEGLLLIPPVAVIVGQWWAR